MARQSFFGTGLFGAGLMALLCVGGMSAAMEQKPEGVVKVACVSGSDKVTVPEEICPLFAQRLAVAYPGALFAPSAPPGRLTLIVTRAGTGLFAARIFRDDGTEGRENSMARQGAALNTEAYTRFLDTLIADGPKP